MSLKTAGKHKKSIKELADYLISNNTPDFNYKHDPFNCLAAQTLETWDDLKPQEFYNMIMEAQKIRIASSDSQTLDRNIDPFVTLTLYEKNFCASYLNALSEGSFERSVTKFYEVIHGLLNFYHANQDIEAYRNITYAEIKTIAAPYINQPVNKWLKFGGII